MSVRYIHKTYVCAYARALEGECCRKIINISSPGIFLRERKRILSFPILLRASITVSAYRELCVSRVTLASPMIYRERVARARRYNDAGNNIFYLALEHMADTFIRSGVKDAIGGETELRGVGLDEVE